MLNMLNRLLDEGVEFYAAVNMVAFKYNEYRDRLIEKYDQQPNNLKVI